MPSNADRDGGPTQPARRGMLLGLAGGALALAGGQTARSAETAAPGCADGAETRQPFYGVHQAGIVTPQPASTLVVAFDVLAERRSELERLFRTLTARIASLTQGGEAPTRDERYPPLESGVLGPVIAPDNLTVTVSVGSSLFDERFGVAALKPRRLAPMPSFPNDALEQGMRHGDLLLQFCANTAETNIHALRDILKNTPGLLAPRWKIDGFLPPRTVRKLGQETVRNLLGFKDGTANLDASDAALMDGLVWATPDSGEPAWAQGGSYQVVRVIRMFVEHWDRTALVEQETIIGRSKVSGAPLGGMREHDETGYADDPQGKTIPLTAHIRLANPRRPDTQPSRILRRGYNYSRGLSAAGQLDMGLLFICYQADLAAGFLAIQDRLNGEALEEYIKPIGGGFFFALPGARSPDNFLGEALLSAPT
jgi:deferrochelatase/peroxidase EfeB